MGAVGTLIGAVIGAGATIYGSYQSKKAQEEAARILEAHYPQAAAVLVREDGTVRILGDLDFTPEAAS